MQNSHLDRLKGICQLIDHCSRAPIDDVGVKGNPFLSKNKNKAKQYQHKALVCCEHTRADQETIWGPDSTLWDTRKKHRWYDMWCCYIIIPLRSVG